MELIVAALLLLSAGEPCCSCTRILGHRQQWLLILGDGH